MGEEELELQIEAAILEDMYLPQAAQAQENAGEDARSELCVTQYRKYMETCKDALLMLQVRSATLLGLPSIRACLCVWWCCIRLASVARTVRLARARVTRWREYPYLHLHTGLHCAAVNRVRRGAC